MKDRQPALLDAKLIGKGGFYKDVAMGEENLQPLLESVDTQIANRQRVDIELNVDGDTRHYDDVWLRIVQDRVLSDN